MRSPVVGRRYFYVDDVSAPVWELIFEPEIGEAHVVVQHREIVSLGPPGNLLSSAIRTSGAVRAIAVSLLKESLVLPLEFMIEDDAADVRIASGQAFSLTQVRTIEVGVMRQFTFSASARIEGLARLVFARSVMLQQRAAPLCEGHQRRSMIVTVEGCHGSQQACVSKPTQFVLGG
jgi:hypothetical protein